MDFAILKHFFAMDRNRLQHGSVPAIAIVIALDRSTLSQRCSQIIADDRWRSSATRTITLVVKTNVVLS